MLFRTRSLLGLALAFALAAASAPACRASVVDPGPSTGGGGTGGKCACPTCCGESLCPDAAPVDGAACSQIGLTCDFSQPKSCPSTFRCASGVWRAGPPPDGSPCDVEGEVCPFLSASCSVATCRGGSWSVIANAPDGGSCCDPDGGACCTPLACPGELPTEGEACSVAPLCDRDLACKYPAPCDPTGTVTATCPTGVWQLDKKSDCGCVGATKAQCKARSACRWVGPACSGTPTLDAAQCEPIAGCGSPTDCPVGYDCTPIAVDPCPGGNCGSCSIVVPECVLQVDG